MTALTLGRVDVRTLDDGAAGDATWRRLLGPGDLFQYPSWQAVVRGTSGRGLRRRVAVRDGEVLAGLASVPATTASPWLLVRPDAQLAAALAADRVDARAVAERLGDAALLPGVVAGGRHVGRTRVVGPAAGEAGVVARLVAEVEREARTAGARCVCFPHVDVGGDGYPGDPVLARVLGERGYLSWEAAQYAWLPVPAGGMPEYMTGLSQHRRRHIRVAGRAIEAAGVQLRFAPLGELPLDVLGAQEAALQHKYGNPADAAGSTELLRSIAAELGEDALVSYAARGAAVLGFGLVLRAGSEWFGHRAGFDYDAQGSLPLYETVLYYAVLDEAARLGARTLHVGVGSDEAKRALRCRSSAQRCFVLPLAAAGSA